MAAAGPSPDDAKLVRTYAPLPTTKRGYGFHLKSNPKGDKMLYTTGRLVIIRNIADPNQSEVFSEHKANVLCATFAPNGNWVASGDDEGNVIIWSYPQMKVKNEVRIGKTVYDIDWDGDSTRIVAAGDGAQNKAKVFNWDSGNNLGEITMCSQAVLACSYRKERPFRIVTASEDLTVNLYEGPPFKYNTSYKGHARYPNSVRFSPDGSQYLSVGADSKIVLFNGTDGAVVKEFGDCKEGHKGSIYAFCWSPDSKQIITASADKTAKIWDVESGNVAKTFTFGGKKAGTNDMQVAALWTKEVILTVSLSGVINYLDINNPDTPLRVIQGHKDNITSISLDRQNGVFYTSSIMGELTRWDFKSGVSTWFGGKALDKVISTIATSADGSALATCSLDDKIRLNETKSLEISSDATDLGGKPDVSAAHPRDADLYAIGLAQEKLVIVRGGRVVSTTALNYVPTAIAFSIDGSRLFVGGKHKKVIIYALDKDTPKQVGEWTEHDKPVTAIQESPDGQWIVSTDKETSIYIRESKSLALKNKTGWRFHQAVVTDAAWAPNAKRLATASNDCDILLWHDFANFSTDRVKIKLAHSLGVEAVRWWDDNTLISVGADRTIRVWEVPAKK